MGFSSHRHAGDLGWPLGGPISHPHRLVCYVLLLFHGLIGHEEDDRTEGRSKLIAERASMPTGPSGGVR